MKLPIWTLDDAGSWTCGDREELRFAREAKLVGFDLPDFDRWLLKLEHRGASIYLLDERERAKTDSVARSDVLTILNLSRWTITRDDTLLPKALRYEKSVDAHKRAAATTNAKAKANNSRRDARIAACARRLILASEATPRTVSGILVETSQASGLAVKAVREILRKAGVR